MLDTRWSWLVARETRDGKRATDFGLTVLGGWGRIVFLVFSIQDFVFSKNLKYERN